MARSISQIKQNIIDLKNATTLSVIKFREEGGSQAGIFNLIADIFAILTNVTEQLWDSLAIQINDTIVKGGVGTGRWWRERILEYQDGDVLKYANGRYYYDVINSEKYLVKFCSVTETANKTITIKVAKGDIPTKLTTPELTGGLKDYVDFLRFAGTQINLVSLDADKFYCSANIYYSGQYYATIQDSVKSALTNYLNSISAGENFNGAVVVSDVQKAIQNVEGVSYVKLNEIGVRQDTATFANRYVLYDLATGKDNVLVNTYAGYVVEETTSGKTFNDTLTFISV
jgi:hypothetical protein